MASALHLGLQSFWVNLELEVQLYSFACEYEVISVLLFKKLFFPQRIVPIEFSSWCFLWVFSSLLIFTFALSPSNLMYWMLNFNYLFTYMISALFLCKFLIFFLQIPHYFLYFHEHIKHCYFKVSNNNSNIWVIFNSIFILKYFSNYLHVPISCFFLVIFDRILDISVKNYRGPRWWFLFPKIISF